MAKDPITEVKDSPEASFANTLPNTHLTMSQIIESEVHNKREKRENSTDRALSVHH